MADNYAGIEIEKGTEAVPLRYGKPIINTVVPNSPKPPIGIK